ncbi:lipid A 4'-phosphatase [Paludibacter sp.]
MSLLDWLVKLDTDIFLFLNGLHTPFLDMPMYYISKVWVWIPLYLGVILFIIKKWKSESIWIILSIVICVVLTDQITNLIKGLVERVRPSHELSLVGLVHNVKGYMSGGFSFVSGHASNVFGFALLSSMIIKNRYYTIFVYLWATTVVYTRIYLGVHYPFDIVGGIILGTGIAMIIYGILYGFQQKLKADIKSRLR